MSREAHVRFWERVGVRFPCATRPICHCSSEEQAAALRVALENRFAECGLTLHPEKTKIVYCKDDDRRGDYPNQKFDFLGYTFRPRLARRRAGKIGVSFRPAVSNKALQAIRPTKGIALSGFNDHEDIRQARDAGFAAHFTKPVDFTKLHKLIDQLV